MRGYSRTERREYEMSPTSSTTIDSTVANTGRRMQVSGSVTASPLGLGGRRVQHGTRRRRDRGVGDLDRDALAQLHAAGGHHGVLGGEALDHLDLAIAARADG